MERLVKDILDEMDFINEQFSDEINKVILKLLAL